MVPAAHGQYLGEAMPESQLRRLPDDGHLTLLQNRVGEVHAWLARYLRAVTVTGTRGRDQ